MPSAVGVEFHQVVGFTLIEAEPANAAGFTAAFASATTGLDGADGVGVPAGGTTGQVLAKASNTDYDDEWVDSGGSGVPDGGTTGQVLAKLSGTDGDADWATPDVTQAELDAKVSDTVYGAGWDTDTTHAPSKNVVYDKVEDVVANVASEVAAEASSRNAADTTLQSNLDAKVSDTAYDATTWNGVTTVAPSKNAVRDKIEAMGTASVSDAVYGAGWDGDTTVAPSKNAVYDKIQTLGAGATNLTYDAPSRVVSSDTGTDATLTVADGTNPGLMPSADFTKLAGVEAGATADMTAAELLTAVKTVDGAGSGLDADLLDGVSSAGFDTAGAATSAQSAAEATAAGALSSHVAAADPHTGYVLESAIGTTVEAHDADLTTIGGLSPSNDDVLQRKAGAWTNRTLAQLLSDLGLTDVGILTKLAAGFTAPPNSLDRWKAGPGKPATAISDAGGISAGDTTLGILDNSILPTTVNRPLLIEDEVVFPTAGATTNSLTLLRGENGSTAATHADGVEITRRRHRVVAVVGDSVAEGVTTSTTRAGDGFIERAARVLGDRYGGFLGRAWPTWRNAGSSQVHQEWALSGSVTAVGATYKDVGFGFGAATQYNSPTSSNNLIWTRPAGVIVQAFDITVVDIGADSCAGSYSIDGGSSWVTFPLTTRYSSGVGILRSFRVTCDNPTTIRIRAANSGGTTKAIVVPAVPLVTYQTLPVENITDGLILMNAGQAGVKLRGHLQARSCTDGNVTNGSPTVTSATQAWVSTDDEGTLYINGVAYHISSVDSGTQVTLSANYAGTTSSTARLSVFPDGVNDKTGTLTGHAGSWFPDLVILGPYDNDRGGTTSLGDANPDFFYDMHTYLIKRLKPTSDVLLIAPHDSSATALLQQQYRDAQALAATEQGVAIFDIYDAMAAQGVTGYTAANAQGWMADTVHLSDTGNQFFAERLIAMLEFG